MVEYYSHNTNTPNTGGQTDGRTDRRIDTDLAPQQLSHTEEDAPEPLVEIKGFCRHCDSSNLNNDDLEQNKNNSIDIRQLKTAVLPHN